MINFTRDRDFLSTIGIGKKALIEKWLDEMEVENYTINDDLSINVKGNVYLQRKDLFEFPMFIKFNRVQGYFACAYNNLTSLKGCPNIVDSWFSCAYNNLSSLDECSKSVGGDFYCHNNKIKFIKENIKKICNIKGGISV
jgi:hypothetical protein